MKITGNKGDQKELLDQTPHRIKDHRIDPLCLQVKRAAPVSYGEHDRDCPNSGNIEFPPANDFPEIITAKSPFVKNAVHFQVSIDHVHCP